MPATRRRAVCAPATGQGRWSGLRELVEIELNAPIGAGVVTAQRLPAGQALLEKLRSGMEAKAAGDWQRSGRGAAHHFRAVSLAERDHHRVGMRKSQGAAANQLQDFIEEETFGLTQVQIGGATAVNWCFRIWSWSSEKARSAPKPSCRVIDSRTRLPSAIGRLESAGDAE